MIITVFPICSLLLISLISAIIVIIIPLRRIKRNVTAFLPRFFEGRKKAGVEIKNIEFRETIKDI